MKHVVGLILILLTLLLTGCASTSMASLDQDAQAKKFTPNPDKASLYIYRNEIQLMYHNQTFHNELDVCFQH